jgi:HEAT repeat protein
MNRGLRHAVHHRAAISFAAWLASTSLLPACAACSDREERRLVHLVELVLAEPGPTADAAEDALVASGSAAILYVETGLYEAEPAGRRRLVRVLARIGDPAASPIFAHLAARDPDPDVRSDAAAGARALESPPLP